MKNYTIKSAEIAKTKEGVSYEFEIELNNKKYEITIDSKGKFIKEELNEDNED